MTKGMMQRHDRMLVAVRKVTEDMIKTGMREYKANYQNGFTLILRDRKSSATRAKNTKDRNCCT